MTAATTPPVVTDWFGRSRRRAGSPPPVSGPSDRPISLRRWESAKTNRLNAAHWAKANSASINQDLLSDLDTLRARASYEIHNNPTLYGIIETHTADVLGPGGPSLQVQTTDDGYATQLERLWRDWWAMPDVAGRLAGVDMMRIWERLRWSDGEFLVQIVNDPDADGVIKTRLNNLSPSRLGTPTSMIFRDDVMLGVQRDQFGRPTHYFIDMTPDTSITPLLFESHQPVRAEDILHDFEDVEPGQVRGVPLLASALQAVADLRDFDDTVLEAARAAADVAVFMKTGHPDAPFAVVNDEVPVERGVGRTLPPGYDLTMVSPNQPAATYVDYRHERLREMGRAVGMPLMMITLDSSDHNFSSARFDGQLYQRGIEVHRARLTRRILNRLVSLVAREAELARVLPHRPENLHLVWDWTPIPHVDPLKERLAITEGLNNGTLLLADVIPGDFDEHVARRKREKDTLEAAGLPATPLRSVGLDKLSALDGAPGTVGAAGTARVPEKGKKQ